MAEMLMLIIYSFIFLGKGGRMSRKGGLTKNTRTELYIRAHKERKERREKKEK